MGKPGRIAFPVILALGAITGYITYTYFTAAIPKQDRIDSPYYQPLSPASAGAATNATTTAANTTTTANSTAANNATTGAANATNATTGAATGNATTGTSPTSTGGAGGTSVSISPGASQLTNTAFNPNPVKVSVGSKVTWTNHDSQPHTVTSGSNGTPDNKFNSSPNFTPLINPGQTFSFTFTQAGNYPYFCMLHPNMVGTVIVS